MPAAEPLAPPAEPQTEPAPQPLPPQRDPAPDPFRPDWPAGRPLPEPKAAGRP